MNANVNATETKMTQNTQMAECSECGNPNTPITKAYCSDCEKHFSRGGRSRWGSTGCGYDSYRDNAITNGTWRIGNGGW